MKRLCDNPSMPHFMGRGANMTESRNHLVAVALAVTCVVLLALLWAVLRPIADPIKVAILHSDTGTMAISERSVRDATLLAIEEINQRGGLLGRKIEPIVVDGKSDWPTFARQAERVITQEKVSVVFGCWTSASRKTVKPIFEEHNHLLFYPVQYEGLEQSPNIVYTGATPNQQLLPAVKWCLDELQATKFFLVGSDYVFPRTANAIMRAQIEAVGGEVVGEMYLLMGSKDVGGIVQRIVEAQPDVILNTINGGTNVDFFEFLRQQGVTPSEIPTMSFSIAEDELRHMDAGAMAGDYAAWNYFQSIDNAANRKFVDSFQRKYGADRVTDDPMEAGYFGVHLWAQAVAEAGTDEVSAVRDRLQLQSFLAPQGIVSIEGRNQHTWKTVRVGRIRDDGQFDVVWTSGRPVRPVPYPIYRSRREWDDFLNELYTRWGGQWANPEKP
jgi:urea transport system substrate-binding protein